MVVEITILRECHMQAEKKNPVLFTFAVKLYCLTCIYKQHILACAYLIGRQIHRCVQWKFHLNRNLAVIWNEPETAAKWRGKSMRYDDVKLMLIKGFFVS